MLNYTDEKLYELCRQYGEQAKVWRQKFAGLLPEVYRRHLYKKKGFGSIFEFAAKLAGMSEEQVSLVLSLHRRFEDKPALRNILEKGEVSVHKLARVVSIATKENQEFLADQVKLLPQAALETLVRDEKTNCKDHAALPAGGKEDVLRTQKLCENLELAQLHISKEVQARLWILQQKGIYIDKLLTEFLDNRELEIAQEKERLSTEVAPAKSRYIPAKIKTILKKEYGDKCSIPQCQKMRGRFTTPSVLPFQKRMTHTTWRRSAVITTKLPTALM